MPKKISEIKSALKNKTIKSVYTQKHKRAQQNGSNDSILINEIPGDTIPNYGYYNNDEFENIFPRLSQIPAANLRIPGTPVEEVHFNTRTTVSLRSPARVTEAPTNITPEKYAEPTCSSLNTIQNPLNSIGKTDNNMSMSEEFDTDNEEELLKNGDLNRQDENSSVESQDVIKAVNKEGSESSIYFNVIMLIVGMFLSYLAYVFYINVRYED